MEERPECDAEGLPVSLSSLVTEAILRVVLERQGMLPGMNRIPCHLETHLLGAGKALLSGLLCDGHTAI